MDNTEPDVSTQPSQDSPPENTASAVPKSFKTVQRMDMKGRAKRRQATPVSMASTYAQLQHSRAQLQTISSMPDAQFEMDSGVKVELPVDQKQPETEVKPVVTSETVAPASPTTVPSQNIETQPTTKNPQDQAPKNSLPEASATDPISAYDTDEDEDNGQLDTYAASTTVKTGYAAIHKEGIGKQNDLPDDKEELKKLVRQYQAQVRQSSNSNSPDAFLSNVEATARLRIQLQQKLDGERQKYDALLDENRRLALRIKDLDKGVLPNYDTELQNRANQTVTLHKKIKEITKERNQFQELYQKAVKRSEAENQTVQKLHKDLFDVKQNNQRVIATLNAELTELRQKHQSLQMKIIELTRLLENEQKHRATAENQMIALKSKAEHYFAQSVVAEVRGVNKYDDMKNRRTSTQNHAKLPEVFRQKNTASNGKPVESTRSELPEVFNPKSKGKPQQSSKQDAKGAATKPQQQKATQQKGATQQQKQNGKPAENPFNNRKAPTNPPPNGKPAQQKPNQASTKDSKNQKQAQQPAAQERRGSNQKGPQANGQQQGKGGKQLQLTKSQQQLKVVLEYNAWVPKNQNAKKK